MKQKLEDKLKRAVCIRCGEEREFKFSYVCSKYVAIYECSNCGMKVADGYFSLNLHK